MFLLGGEFKWSIGVSDLALEGVCDRVRVGGFLIDGETFRITCLAMQRP